MLILIIVSLLGTVQSSNAEQRGLPASMGILVGFASPNAASYTGRIGYGLTFSYRAADYLDLGIYYRTSSKEEDLAGLRRDLSASAWGTHLTYIFGMEQSEIGAGLMLGFGNRDLKFGATSLGASSFAFGPRATYDYFVSESVSLGAELNFVIVSDTVETGQKFNSFNLFHALGVLKFWY